MPWTWQLQSVPTHRKMRSLRSDTERCSSTSEVTFRLEPQVRLIALTPPGESKAFLNQKENFSSDSQSNVNTVILERRGEGACVCTSSSGEFKHPPVSAWGQYKQTLRQSNLYGRWPRKQEWWGKTSDLGKKKKKHHRASKGRLILQDLLRCARSTSRVGHQQSSAGAFIHQVQPTPHRWRVTSGDVGLGVLWLHLARPTSFPCIRGLQGTRETVLPLTHEQGQCELAQDPGWNQSWTQDCIGST